MGFSTMVVGNGQTLGPGCFASGFLGDPLTCFPAPGRQSSLSVGEGSEAGVQGLAASS